MKQSTIALAALVFTLGTSSFCAAATSPTPPTAQPLAPLPEKVTIHARAINMNPGAGPNTGQLMITLERRTTDEEVSRYIEAFNAGGQDAVVRLWQKEEPVVGRIRFATTLGYDLRLARIRNTEKGQKLFLATDRPISGFEMMRGLRSEDHPIGWIELDIQADEKGEGRMVAAAQLVVKDNSLIIESLGTQPLRLNNIRVKSE